MWPEFGIVLGSYLLGAFPWPYIIGRLRGVDLRHEEDQHIALWRKVGPGVGFIGVVGDIAKGVIAVLVARALGFELLIVALCMLAVVVGEMWSVFLRFRGEKANTTAIGAVVAFTPEALVIPLVPMAAGAILRAAPALLRHSTSLRDRLSFVQPPSLSLPLGMVIGFAILPLSAWWLGEGLIVTLTCLGVFLLIVTKRLTAGLREDLKAATSKRSIIMNRILYDRSYR